MQFRIAVLAVLFFAAGASACIPYTVGTTAQPVAPGETASSQMIYVMPSIGDTSGRSATSSSSQLSVDGEIRFGVDEKSDVGLRGVGYSGLVVNYKRLVEDTAAPLRIAIMPGIGIVNAGNHAYAEFTLIVSGREPPTTYKPAPGERMQVVPYAGLRASKVWPIQEDAVEDEPTYGGFVGMRFGTTEFGVSPEVGVFHDHSALGVRRSDIVVVPAIVIHGTRLIDMFRRIPRRYDRSDPRDGGAVGRGYPDVPSIPPILLPPSVRPTASPVWAPPMTVPGAMAPRPSGTTCWGPQRECNATRRSAATARPRS